MKLNKTQVSVFWPGYNTKFPVNGHIWVRKWTFLARQKKKKKKKKKKATDKWGVGRGDKEPLFTTIGTLLKSYGFSVIYSTLIRSLLNLMDPDNFFQLIL